jgi:hypothetical protein
MSKKKQESPKTINGWPVAESNDKISVEISRDHPSQAFFNYLKENVIIQVRAQQSWGYHEDGSLEVGVTLLAKNPETGKHEVISDGNDHIRGATAG